MGDFRSIGEMMESCAAEAVQKAHDDFGFHLDYSEASLASLETILSCVGASLQATDKEAVERQVKRWGGYFGEVVRRRWQGAWDLVQYPGGKAAVPTLLVAGSQLYPLMKVYRRLTLGETENLCNFYEKIRHKLSGVYPTEGSD
jgi:hypothetical protein